jgi:hypothetical protein
MTRKNITKRIVVAAAALCAVLLGWAGSAHAQIPCTVTLSMTDAVTLASLQFNVSYTRPDIEFVGTGAGVSCTNQVSGGFPSVSDDDAGNPGVLDAAYLVPTGFTGPQQLLVCDVDALVVPAPGDFTVQVVDASDPLLQPVVPLPAVEVTNVNCTGTTTTSSTTTTTFGGTTTTLGPGAPMPCTVEFNLDDAVALGSLQYDVDYLNAPGEFDGNALTVQCQNLVPNAFPSSQDNEGLRMLTTAIISLAGFTGPMPVTRCDFSADTIPVDSDFQVIVTDAADTSIVKLNPFPAMSVGTISCPLGGTTSTTLWLTTTTSTTSTTTTSTTSTTTTSTTTTSTTTTTLPAVCGNGIPEGSEQCDDGNGDNTDACLDTCETAACGDGFVRAGLEQCDDGAANSNADPVTCRLDCTDDDVCGDTDANGQVTAVDSLYVLRAAVGLVSDCPLTRCDASGDGQVTVADSQRILFVSVSLPATLECTVPLYVQVAGGGVYGTLSVEIDYAATGESFLWEDGAVDCSGMIGGAGSLTFDNDAGSEMLAVDLVSAGGVGAPADLAVCRFRGRDVPASGEFSATVVDARDPGGSPVTPPAVAVTF